VNWLFDSMNRSLLEAVLSIDIMILSVLCPPLGEALNLAGSAWQYGEAEERLAAWKGLIDPVEVMNYAELEAELFARKLGLAFAAIPYAGRAAGEIRAVAT